MVKKVKDPVFITGSDKKFSDFIDWMRDRNESIGDSPKSLGAGRRPGLRKDHDAWNTYIASVNSKQIRASFGAFMPPHMKEKLKHDTKFQNACDLASITATRRQYSKWLRGRGAARTAFFEHENEQKEQV